MRSARRKSEPLAIARSSSAAVVARRSGSDGSSETGASGVSAISPSTCTMSGPRSAGAGGYACRSCHGGSVAAAEGSGPRDGAAARRRR